ncbi:hypothetical protein [Williamsia sp.]|uniref:hypothetical protein n=1 Tax=Williamsia sp. TaxID=1872085 RepID=UPI001A21C6F7|nr:hypothetical protein [Williamsia sp.]MBJ7287559.1 hypothetical protein [Williamsia sp.]
MISTVLASTATVLADIGPSSPQTPTGGDKWQSLLNMGLWAAVAVLALIGVFAGVKFAASYVSGESTRERMMILGGVCVGAVFTGTAVALVNSLALG